MSHRVKLRLVLLVYVLLVIVVSLIPPPVETTTVLPVDKIGHFFAYAGMAVLALLSFDTWTARIAALVGAVGLGALLEWGQSFIPGRDMSWIDELANTLGVLGGSVAFRFYGRVLIDWTRSHLKW